MGYKILQFKLPTDFTEEQLQKKIESELGFKSFTWQIEKKSLDARKRNFIHWQTKVVVTSDGIKGKGQAPVPALSIPHKKQNKKAMIVGSGPAGFFCAYILQKAGFTTTLIEQGQDVDKRSESIDTFEKTGQFNSAGNYAFGEGGAGTFSDGKLTARSKNISREKNFILSSYVDAGAPDEIMYMTHPHLGSDNLRTIVKNLRQKYLDAGGTLHFETRFDNLNIKDGRVVEVLTSKENIEADQIILAPGHSAFDTYRMLIRNGVIFRTKNFAIGSRVEHPQALINKAQWGKELLPGVKAAEYRLTSKTDGQLPVYTFCNCPGGIVVPSTASAESNIVNGMSLYKRNGRFANAGCVAGVNPEKLIGKEINPLEILDWLESLEKSFYAFSEGFRAPFCTIQNFITHKEPSSNVESSYPLGLKPAPLWAMLPPEISRGMKSGLKDFSKKIRGFETGNIMGLESKTSSPVQVVRDNHRRCEGFENLYLVGEGSGLAGGIISSGVDGIKTAMEIIEMYH